MEFEWDPIKAELNLQKHGVSFSEAASVLGDTLSVTVSDPDHSLDEERYITVGLSHLSRLLIVAHTDRGDNIRIISARELTRQERRVFEDDKF
ncbi:MAG: BrnT family toxin [Anaerolineales bacterium]|nr:BrnT family toxin [Anaerolineales bacterium]